MVHPPGRHPPQQTPLADTPPWQAPPWQAPPPGYGQRAGGTHRTGMHSCFFEDCSQRFDRNAKGDAMLLQFDDPYHTVKRMLTHLGLLDLLHVFTSNAIRVRLFSVFTKAIMGSAIFLSITSLSY